MKTTTIVLVALAAYAAPLAAQFSLETGSGQSRLDQLPSSSLTRFSGAFLSSTPRFRLSIGGGVEDHVGLGVEGRFSGAARYRTTAAGWSFDAGPVIESGQSIAEPWATTAAGEIGAERAIGPVTARVSWDQGLAWIGAQNSSWSRPMLDAELHLKSWRFGASWQSTSNRIPVSSIRGDAPPVLGNSDSLGASSFHDIRDFAVRMAWDHGLWSMNARAGRRFGVSVTPETWWEGEGAMRITPLLSVVVRAGQLAADPMLASRGGGYTTAGVKLDLVHHTPETATPPQPVALASVVRENVSTVHVYLVLPDSTHTASFTGDLTEWRAQTLRRTGDGRWEIVLPAVAGVYRVAVSTNGGAWQPPAGLPSDDDGFGGRVGLLLVR